MEKIACILPAIPDINQSMPVSGSQANSRPFIGVGVLIWHQGKLLLGERLQAGAENCWQFPGGRLEYGEDVLECAAREVLEETGLSMHQMKPVAYSHEVYMAGESHYVTLYVSAQLLSGEPVVMEPQKCKSWQWFHPSALPAPLFTPITHLLNTHPDLEKLV